MFCLKRIWGECINIFNLKEIHKIYDKNYLFQIKIIHEPNVFYSILVEKCKSARKRITFASLYLGTGKLESNLVSLFQNLIKDLITLKLATDK